MPITDPITGDFKSFTPEEKESIKKKAAELVASGMAPGKAAQEAVSSLGLLPAVQKATSSSQSGSLTQESRLARSDLLAAEQDYKTKRTVELMKGGVSETQAKQQAESELSTAFLPPVAPGYGDLAERKKSGFSVPLVGGPKPAQPVSLTPQQAGKEGTFDLLKEAMSPQVKVPNQEDINKALERAKEVKVDWNKILKQYVDSGMQKDEADAYVQALKIAYETNLGKSFADLYKTKGAQGASQEILATTIKEIGGIEAAIQDTSTYIKSGTAKKPIKNVWYQAFSPQAGENVGVPNLTDAQIEYLNELSTKQLDNLVKKALESNRTKKVYIDPSGKEVSETDYQDMVEQKKDVSKYKLINKPYTEKELRPIIEAENPDLVAKPWWRDQDKKRQVLENPEKFTEKGIFTTTHPLEGTAETGTGWLLRMVTIPFNIAPGLAGAALEEVSPDWEKKRKEERAKTAPMYIDSPVLLNIAQGRGFTGEAAEIAKIGDFSEQEKSAIVALGFAVDIFDPFPDILVAAGKGGMLGKQLYNAEKALGVQSAGKAFGYGSKVAIDNFVESLMPGGLAKPLFSPGDVRNVAAREAAQSAEAAVIARKALDSGALPEEALKAKGLENTAWSKRFKAEGGSAAAWDAASRDSMRISSGEDLIQESNKIAKEVDNMISGEPLPPGSAVRQKELGRQIGALARIDDDVAKILRQVDAAGGTGPKLEQYMKALASQSPASVDSIKSGLIRNKALIEVYKATKDNNLLDNIVAVTKNVYANKKDAAIILEKVGNSEIGQVAKNLKQTKPEAGIIRITGREGMTEIVPVVNLTEEQAAQLSRGIAELYNYRKLDRANFDRIRKYLTSKKIALKDLRSMIDANIDLVAEGMTLSRGGKVSAVRSRDIARLPTSKQTTYLEPLEARSFGSQVFKDTYAKITGQDVVNPSNLSIGQKQLLDSARQKASSLDVKLRQNMSQIMSDAATRKLYTGTEAPITRENALQYLIVGPKGGSSLSNIKETLDMAAHSLVFNKYTAENIFDPFMGTSVRYSTSPLNSLGQANLSEVASELAIVVQDNPTRFSQAVKIMADEMARMVADPAFVGSDEGLVKVLEKTKGIIPKESILASYYAAEIGRINNGILQDLVNTEIGKGNINITDALGDANYQVAMQERLSKELGFEIHFDDDEFNSKLINARIETQLTDPTWNKRAINKQDIENIFEIDSKKLDLFRSTKNLENNADIGYLINAADDVAGQIIRRNSLKSPHDMRAVTDAISSIYRSEDELAQLKIIFGEDVAAQLVDQFKSGYKQIQNALQSEIRSSYSSTRWEKLGKAIEDKWSSIENMRYILLLNMRPRFHGANLITGTDIYRATTGKTPNPLSMAEGAKILATGDTKPYTIIFTDKAGRPYTSGELYNALTMEGGKSVYKASAPTIDKADLDSVLYDYKVAGGLSDKSKNILWKWFKNLPSNEDLLFRYSAMKSALDEGRSLEDATALARKSMFDAGTKIPIESLQKIEDATKAARIFLFYGFARNNLMNLLKNASSAKGILRIGKSLKFKQAAEQGLDYAAGRTENDYIVPDAKQTRIFLDNMPYGPSGQKELQYYSPSIPTLDAIKMFSDLIQFKFADVAGPMLSPTYKEIFDIDTGFGDPNVVPPEHIALLKSVCDVIPGTSIEEILSTVTGAPVVARKGTKEEGAIFGYVYPLNTPEQKSNYKYWMNVISFFGFSSPATDFIRTAAARGDGLVTAGEVDQPLPELARSRIAYLTALSSPSKAASALKEDISGMKARTAAINDAIKDISQDSKMEAAAIKEETKAAGLPVATERKKKSDIIQGRQTSKMDDEQRLAELNTRYRSLAKSFRGRRRTADEDAEMKQINKERAEIRARLGK